MRAEKTVELALAGKSNKLLQAGLDANIILSDASLADYNNFELTECALAELVFDLETI